MRTALTCSAVFALFSCAALAQDFPRAEIYGGFSYVNIDANSLASRQSAYGWEAAVSGNFNKWFAVEGDVSGYYKNYDISSSSAYLGEGTTTNVKVTDYSFAGGPRINFKPIFVHALFGGDHLTGSALGSSLSQDGLAGLVGGGVQFPVSKRLSLRASGDYVFTRHNILAGPSTTQNNFRAGIGLVYSFGKASERERAANSTTVPEQQSGRGTDQRAAEADNEARSIPAARSDPRAPETKPDRAAATPIYTAPQKTPTGMPVPALGLVAATRQDGGAEVSEVLPGSVAQFAGLRSGDVINVIDGKSIRTPMELAAELSDRKAGDKIRIGYLVRGWWQTETVVVLPTR